MDSAFASVITKIQGEITPLEEKIQPIVDQIKEKKKLINQLCAHAGEPPAYPEAEADTNTVTKPTVVRADEYFGRPVATVVKEILAPRKGVQGAMALDELFDQMKAGGFAFDSKNDMLAKRGISITLGKNPAFIKVPTTGCWGLTEWYPNVRRGKGATVSLNNANEQDARDDGLDETNPEELPAAPMQSGSET